MEILMALGVPSALFSLLLWFFKKHFKMSEDRQAAQQADVKDLALMMIQSARANTILCKATAEAVRDGHCNGNMSSAMQAVDKVAAEEKEFLLKRSVKYIFD